MQEGFSKVRMSPLVRLLPRTNVFTYCRYHTAFLFTFPETRLKMTYEQYATVTVQTPFAKSCVCPCDTAHSTHTVTTVKILLTSNEKVFSKTG